MDFIELVRSSGKSEVRAMSMIVTGPRPSVSGSQVRRDDSIAGLRSPGSRDLLPDPGRSITSIAKLLNVSPGTFYNHIPDLPNCGQPGRSPAAGGQEVTETPDTAAVQALAAGQLREVVAAYDDTPLRVNVPEEEHPMEVADDRKCEINLHW